MGEDSIFYASGLARQKNSKRRIQGNLAELALPPI